MTSDRVIVNKRPVGSTAPKKGTEAYWLAAGLKSLAFEGPLSRYDLAKNVGVSWAYIERLTKELQRAKLIKAAGKFQGPKHTVTRYGPTAQGLFALKGCDEETERNWIEILERNSRSITPEDSSILKLDVPPMRTENDPRTVQSYPEALLDFFLDPDTPAEDLEDAYRKIEDVSVRKRIIIELTEQAADFKKTVERNTRLIQKLSITR